MTEVGFPGFGYPGVGQDSIEKVFVTVFPLNSVTVFVLKTVMYEVTDPGGLVVKGGKLDPLKPVLEGRTLEDESTDEMEELLEGG
jgi:hypothetical protein